VIATNPMEIVKIRMQMQALLPVEARQSTAEVVRGLGLKGLYQGTAATLSRDVPFSVLFFPGYANIKAMMADKDGNNSMVSNLVAGVAAGALASGAVTPSDVIKTRYQLNHDDWFFISERFLSFASELIVNTTYASVL
jgi:Mitochondrial carrier protein